MKKLSHLTLQYYRILLLYNFIFTLVWLVFALFGFGQLNVAVCFWAMFCGFWSAAAIHYYSAKETYFYFRNAGARMRKVIALAFLFDLLFFVTTTIAYYAIRNIKG